MMVLWSLVCYVSFFIVKASSSQAVPLKNGEDLRRPIWNIAHMVNSIPEVDYYLDQGANSVEFDVTFDPDGTAAYIYHGIPCDCFRHCLRYESFTTYIDYLRQVTTPGDSKFRSELGLHFMDTKVQKLKPSALKRAGEDVAKKLIEHYWQNGTSGARAYIVISVPSVKQKEFVQSIRETLEKSKNASYYMSQIGFDFYQNDDLDSIESALKEMKIFNHVWQGDGSINCWFRGTRRLRDAIRRRDEPGRSPIEKVYWWTVDRKSTMRSTLRLGVDGMITNHPSRLYSVLKENEFSGKFRLATIKDSPWEKFPSRSGNFTDNYFMNEEDEILYNI